MTTQIHSCVTDQDKWLARTNPTVSILIPVYNRENFISPCIESALSQNFSDFEVVVVDNCSTDGTWEICKLYADNDSRVRVFRNETNIGPVRNWLRCVEEAQGQYGKLLFSDDLMFPDFLENTLPYLSDPETAFVVSGILLGDTPQSCTEYLNNDYGKLSNKEYFEKLISKLITYSPGAAIFRMSDIRENLKCSFPTRLQCTFERNGAGPDVMLYAQTALRYKYVVFSPTRDIFFRAHPGSFSIGSEKDDVQRNYTASLALFCKKHLDRSVWSKHIAKAWTSKVKKNRGLCSLRKLCFDLEGDGTIIELALVCVYIFKALIQSFARISVSHFRSPRCN